MNTLLVLFSVFLAAFVVASDLTLNQEVFGAGTGENVGDTADFQFVSPGAAANIYITWFPCRGKMDFKVESDRFGDRTADGTESTGVTYRTLSYQQVNPDDTFDIVITNKWSVGTSIFNVVASTEEVQTIEPGNDGKISAKFVDGKSKLRVEWTGTGTDGDTYSLWASDIAYQSDNFGQLLSACGVEDWMELVASDSDISNDGDTYYYEADVDDDSSVTDGTFTVIVSRDGALDGVYNLVTSTGVSGASMVGIPKVAIFFLFAFLVALFKY